MERKIVIPKSLWPVKCQDCGGTAVDRVFIFKHFRFVCRTCGLRFAHLDWK